MCEIVDGNPKEFFTSDGTRPYVATVRQCHFCLPLRSRMSKIINFITSEAQR